MTAFEFGLTLLLDVTRGEPKSLLKRTSRIFTVHKLHMSHLDDLPKRDDNRRIQEQSETVFTTAISECGEFEIQSNSMDKHDYGTDFQIEAINAGVVTNVRVQVQLKGTTKKKNADGSVSLSINRSNFNYLTMPSGSIFVCYHVPSERLLVRRVDDVFRKYEHSSVHWHKQKTITVRFEDCFDQNYQCKLKEFVVAHAKAARDRRLDYAAHPPDKISDLLEEEPVDLPVPADEESAGRVLKELYEEKRDKTISRSFEKFRVVLGTSNRTFLPAYMAEINLGIDGGKCDKSRIACGIEIIGKFVDSGHLLPGSMLYCIGNGWLALEEYEKARDAYNSALSSLDHTNHSNVAALCYKNLGTVLERLNKPDEARVLYTRALELDPGFAEAHFALGLWHYRNGADFDRALEHLDAIMGFPNSAGTMLQVQGWRAAILFKQGKMGEAFRDIRALIGEGDKLPWTWPWCTKLVAMYGRRTVTAAQFSVQFWDEYLRRFPGDLLAQSEKLLCIWFVHANGGQTEWEYYGFKKAVAEIVTGDVPDPAFLWDRVGHWAEDEKNWMEAEKCYRKAFELSPNEYGYCLGTALNFLGRFAEALPILLLQAEEHQPDAMSWFQVAIAKEGTNDVEGCISAYERTLQLDEDCDLAWFNLGGVFWNSGNLMEAFSTWKEAMRRFPKHELSSKLKKDFPILLTL